jgi:hypothetical protein
MRAVQTEEPRQNDPAQPEDVDVSNSENLLINILSASLAMTSRCAQETCIKATGDAPAVGRRNRDGTVVLCEELVPT